MIIAPLVFVSAPWGGEVDPGASAGFLVGGTDATLLWVELGLVPLTGKTMSRFVFWGVCELSTTLDSLSADGCVCVSILLIVWPEAFQHWSLQVVGWHWVLLPKCGPLGELPGASATSVLFATASYSQPSPLQETLQEPWVGVAQVLMELLLCVGTQCT